MDSPIVMWEKPVEPMVEHEVRLRAYDLFLRRGRVEGHALDDWLEAECEILREMQSYSLSYCK